MKCYDLPLDLNDNSRERKIIDFIKPDTVILEFGCSYGRLAKFLKDVKRCKVYGIEIDLEAFRIAKNELEDGICTDINLMDWKKYFQNITFDYILFADVLEHLNNPEKVLIEARSLLKEDGQLIFSIPNIAHADIINKLVLNKFDYTETGLLDKTHLRFWGSENLISLCKESGFVLTELDGTYQIPNSTEQAIGINSELSRMIAAKRYGDVFQFICRAVKKEYADLHEIGFTNRLQDSKNIFRRKIKIYFDYGNGFSENEIETIYVDYSSNVEITLFLNEQVKNIRFDPCEGCGCIVSNLHILFENREISDYSHNGKGIENKIFFDALDSWIIIPKSTIQAAGILKIQCTLIVLDNFECKCFFEELKGYHEQKIQIENEYNDIKEKLRRTEELYAIVQKSKDELSSCVKGKEDSIEILNEKVNLLNTRCMNLEEDCKKLNSYSIEKKLLVEKLSEENSLLIKEKEELYSTVQIAKNELLNYVKEKEEYISNLNEKIGLLSSSCTHLEENCKKLNKHSIEKELLTEKLSEEICLLNREKEDLYATIQEAKDELLNYAKEKEEYIITLNQKEKVTKNLNEEISVLNKEKKELYITVQEIKDELLNCTKEKKKYIDSLNEQQQLTEKLNQEICLLSKEKEELQRYRDALINYNNEKDAVIVELKSQAINSQIQEKNAEEQLLKYQSVLNNYKNDIFVAHDQLDMVLNSNSWKITDPLRKVIRKLKHLDESVFIQKPQFNEYVVVDILMPVQNESSEQVEKTIKSFLNQSIVEKHLIALLGKEVSADVCALIQKYASQRVEIDCLEVLDFNVKNILNLFKASKYVGVIYPGDILASKAVAVINDYVANNEFDMAYTDSAYIDGEDIKETRYKPDFSRDTLRAFNYMQEMLIFNKAFLFKIPVCLMLDNSYDLVLKTTDYTTDVRHIAEMVYLKDVNSILYHPDKDIKALESHLARNSIVGTVSKTDIAGIYRIQYAIENPPLVSIIIPNKDHIEDLKVCLDSIFKKSTYKNFEIIIIENNSIEEKTFEFYKKINKKNVKVVTYQDVFNYSKINNFGVKEAKGEYYLFLNNDVAVISPNWIQEMLMFCQRNDVGAVGAKLYYPDMRIQHAGVILGVGGVAAHAFRMHEGTENGYMNRLVAVNNVSIVTGACLMMKASLFEVVRGFNEALPVDFNDVDLCMKIRRMGMNIVFTPYAELYHYESISRGTSVTKKQQLDFAESVKRFQRDWAFELQKGDPYYNKNFTLDNADFVPLVECQPVEVISQEESVRNEEEIIDESMMSITQKLDCYLDIDNYPRALEVLNHKCRFDIKKQFDKGLSIVILNLNKPELIVPLLEKLVEAKKRFKRENFELEILVGDTGSKDKKVLDVYKRLSNNVKVIYNMKYNFSRCNNEVFEKLATKKYTLFLNNDVVFPNAYESLKLMVKQFENKEIGIVGSYLFYPDKNVQHMGIDFFKTGEAAALCYHPNHMQKVAYPKVGHVSYTPATTGACLMIRSDLFLEVDGFDENYIEECQDVALCLSTRRLGYEIVTVFTDEVLHLENATRPKGSESWKDRRYFLRKWKSYIEVL